VGVFLFYISLLGSLLRGVPIFISLKTEERVCSEFFLGMAKLTNLSLATAFECLVVEQALSVND
jgi:hypothetical protein